MPTGVRLGCRSVGRGVVDREEDRFEGESGLSVGFEDGGGGDGSGSGRDGGFNVDCADGVGTGELREGVGEDGLRGEEAVENEDGGGEEEE